MTEWLPTVTDGDPRALRKTDLTCAMAQVLSPILCHDTLPSAVPPFAEGPVTLAVQGRIDNQDSWGTITTGAVSGRWRFHTDCALRYRQPASGGSWMPLDLRLGRRILSGMWRDLKATHVSDHSITEMIGVPLPGRWGSFKPIWRRGGR